MPLVHATCVSIDDKGVLLRGASGCGKSDLALRLIDRGGYLIADDQVLLTRIGDRVIARPPAALAGLLEIRGVGIVKAPSRPNAALALVVDLDPASDDERLPNEAQSCIEGIVLPRLAIAARHASADAVIRLALRTLADHGSHAGALGDAEHSPPRVTA